MHSDSESLVNQINEDLDWLRIKLKKAQKYEPTAEIVAFERKLVRRLIELNQYAARFGAALEHFSALTWSLTDFNVEAEARAIRSAKKKWRILEKAALNRDPQARVRSGRR